MKPTVHYDPEADAARISLSRAAYHESEEVLPGVVLDFDAEGRLIGLEILRARERLAPDTLGDAEALSAKRTPIGEIV